MSPAAHVQREAHFVSGGSSSGRCSPAWPAGSVAELSGDLLLMPGSLAEPAGKVFLKGAVAAAAFELPACRLLRVDWRALGAAVVLGGNICVR